MSSRSLFATLCVLGAVGVGCTAPVENEEVATTLEDPLSADEHQDLSKARIATAKYHDVNVAIADGYVQLGGCAASPAGGMGTHYGNFDLIFQPPSAEKPQILLYETGADGALHLAGVEYFQAVMVGPAPWFGPVPPPPPPTSNSAPSLFGQTFDGVNAPVDPSQPWNYSLHVWIWKNNPAGQFNMWNPSIVCP